MAAAETLPADVIIDATGRRTPFPAWLRELPLLFEEETAATGIIYYTRFYRLRPGQEEPARTAHSSMGDLGYLKFGVFPADNHTFSLTLAVPTVETDLRLLRYNDAFTTACCALPALAPWLEPNRAEPLTDVLAMGGLRSCYRHFVCHGRPVILGYFGVGEAAIHTNPLYGRGCSLSFLHARLLADVLATTHDPTMRALQFHRLTERELRPFFDEALRQDRRSLRRAQQGMQPCPTVPWFTRLAQTLVQHGLIPALRSDLTIRRAFMRDFHMLDLPGVALRRPRVILRLVRVFLQTKRRKAGLYPPPPGPDRTAMRHLLGLDGHAIHLQQSPPEGTA
jgi:flavin-dependent dehydrogenase